MMFISVQKELAPKLVPLSQPLENGTVGQEQQKRDKMRDKMRDKNGTSNLKLLAYKVLERDKTWDKNRTNPKKNWDKTAKNTLYCPTLQRPNIAQGKIQNSRTLDVNFCPLEFLNERGVGVMDVDPVKGILLTTDYACSDTLRNMIGLWTLGHFDCLLSVLNETRPIARKVTCKSLNLYRLPLD